MAVVRVVLSTSVRPFPFGTQAGPLKITLKGAGGEEVFLEQEASPFVFPEVAVGTYTVTAERLDAAGARLGDAVTVSFVVNPSTVEISVPINMTITQE
jgi:hypothetical protein